MEQQDKTYSYQEIFSEYFFQENTTCSRLFPYHVLIFVYSGELIVRTGQQKTRVREGGYIFLCRDNNIILEKKPFAEQLFRSAFMGFSQSFLNEFYSNLNKKKLPQNITPVTKNIIEIAKNPYLDSLYISMKPYFEWDENPIKKVLEIKLTEAVYCLLAIDKKKFSCLFEAIQNSKKQTVSTSKCILNPAKDLTTRCIETAYLKIQDKDKTTDIYMEVEYKNIRNIIQTYDDRYGLSLLN